MYTYNNYVNVGIQGIREEKSYDITSQLFHSFRNPPT